MGDEREKKLRFLQSFFYLSHWINGVVITLPGKTRWNCLG